MDKKFCIVIGHFPAFFLHGDEERLIELLSSFGVKQVTSENCQWKNLGVVFNRKITLSFKGYGLDRNGLNNFKKELVALCAKYSQTMAINFLDNYKVNEEIIRYFNEKLIEIQAINLYCSDNPLQLTSEKNVFIVPRHYDNFDVLTFRALNRCVEDYLGTCIENE